MGNLSTKTTGSRDSDIEELKILVNGLKSSMVGMMTFSPPTAVDGSIDAAWVKVAGQILSRAAYPALWARVKLMGNYVSDAEWLAIKVASPNGAVSVYSSGDGSTTFRMPTVGEDGGFIRATGTDPVLNALRDLQGGFDHQTEEHKHGTPIVDATSVAGRVGVAANFSENNYPFGYRTFGDIEDAIYANVPYNYLNFTVGTDVPSGLISLLTSAATFDHSGETHPKGMFGTLYVFSGNATTHIPEVTPDWLIQQDANTQAIADLAKKGETLLWEGVLKSGETDSLLIPINGFDKVRFETANSESPTIFDQRSYRKDRLLSNQGKAFAAFTYGDVLVNARITNNGGTVGCVASNGGVLLAVYGIKE